jgi:hypothetical protein
MNVVDGKFITLSGQNTTPRPKSGYYNSIDNTPNYTYIRISPEVGWNDSLTTNMGRTGLYANRVKIVHEGQGDATAYNASVRVRGRPRPGTSNWIASPAGVILNGTISGEADGVYLNPLEIHMSDTPAATSFNVAAYGIVINGSRNRSSGPQSKFGGTGIGQVWGGARFQSEGLIPWDNIISAQGKFSVGIDLSMSSADFGADKAAIAMKPQDRLYFDCSASGVDNNNTFIREDKRATSCKSYVTFNNSRGRIEFYVSDKLVLSFSPTEVIAGNVNDGGKGGIHIDSDGIYKDISGSRSVLIGGRVSGWRRMTGNEDKNSSLDTSTVTLKQLAERVKALESALHSEGGPNGLISP